jgi:hypothetical protein
MRHLAAILCCACALGAAAAPPTIRWYADTERPAAQEIPVWQGETVRLVPTFREQSTAVDLAGGTFSLYWQTNGMGVSWWSVPAAAGSTGEVVATWSPTNDIGAARYTFFIASTSASGTSYRAHGRLLMRAAPGATPSILAAPTTLTDALVTLLLSGPLGSTSNLLDAAAAAYASAAAAAGSNYVRSVAATNPAAVAAAAALADTALLDLAGTRAMTGDSVTLARDVKTRDAATAGYGAAFGLNTLAGSYGAAFGLSTLSGSYGAAFGAGSTAGDYGLVAGNGGIGAAGSFVFADSQAAAFNRNANADAFSVRAAGGAYFAVPTLTVTGSVAATSYTGSGAALTGVAKPADLIPLTNTIPSAGCTQLAGVTPEISGATYAYFLVATNAYTLSVSASAPRYHYSLEVLGAHAATLASALTLRGTWTPTGTNIVTLVPGTGAVWRVYGRGL